MYTVNNIKLKSVVSVYTCLHRQVTLKFYYLYFISLFVAVIYMEGGNDFDLKALDFEEKQDNRKSFDNGYSCIILWWICVVNCGV